tara:strand:+ start:18211 stop:18825 length:615 start_codon:yes stop_codon:yes gene_type:complete
MKEILITSRSIQQHDENYYSLDSNWIYYFENYKVISIPNNHTKLSNYLTSSAPAAIVLSGGGDIEANKLSKNFPDLKREEVEEALIKYGIDNNIPIIAICRGMQKTITYLSKNIIFTENPVKIKEYYLLDECITEETFVGNKRTCFNDYSIKINDEINNNWHILCADKQKNLISSKHKKFNILCFIWHPERDFTDYEIIKSFIE